jgi:hypothetical protein
MDRSLTNLDIVREINRPQFSPVFLVKDKGVMGFPHQKFLRKESLYEIEQSAPSLVPLVEGEVELPIVNE